MQQWAESFNSVWTVSAILANEYVHILKDTFEKFYLSSGCNFPFSKSSVMPAPDSSIEMENSGNDGIEVK